MATQVLSTQYVALIGLVWSMTQRGDDAFYDAFRQSRGFNSSVLHTRVDRNPIHFDRVLSRAIG
jgi:hypothetical protein